MHILTPSRIIVAVAVITFLSCAKDPSSIPGAGSNGLPVADAGPDINISYDRQTGHSEAFTLDGTSSFDPDGSISKFSWGGDIPITTPDSAKLILQGPDMGRYEFVLTVTDNSGITDIDAVIVNITSSMNQPGQPVIASFVGSLSQARVEMAVAAAGTKILFAGGFVPNHGVSTRVDIFDTQTGEWSTSELSVPRHNMAVAVAGNKVFFAGGSEAGWWDYGSMFSNVDIYDLSGNNWSVAHLSEARGWISAATTSKKVFFGGGINNNYQHSKSVDVYDLANNTWTVMTLGRGKGVVHMNAWNDKIYFAGGAETPGAYTSCSDKIDIYDSHTGQWTASVLSEPKLQMQSVVHGNKIIWAGGVTPMGSGSRASSKVEIRDLSSGAITITSLNQPNFWNHFNQVPTIKGNKVLFYQGCASGALDILDVTTGEWVIGQLDKNISWASSVATNNHVYLAGGYVDGMVSGKVWKLDL